MTEPIHILSLGAGVQSSTMALMAAHGEITPMPKCAIFADTQDEPQSVYKWLDWLEKQLPFPVVRVSAGRLSDSALRTYWSVKNQKKTVMGLPFHHAGGIYARQCTSNYKHDPISKAITIVMRKYRVKKAIKWIGISLDELHRMKPSRRSTVTHRWPLVDARINRWSCLEWMKRNCYPEPPKSACIYCPFSSDSQFRNLRDSEPKSFDLAVHFEQQIQRAYEAIGLPKPFIHKSCKPLDQVDFSTDEDHGQQVMFGNECEGMCSV